jgi:hypothetical protein
MRSDGYLFINAKKEIIMHHRINRNQPPRWENPTILKGIENSRILEFARQYKGMRRYGKMTEIDFERFCYQNGIEDIDSIMLTLKTILGNTYRKTLRGVYRMPEKDGESIADEIVGVVDHELDG